MANFAESVLNCVGLFVGPLMLVAAMAGALALLQRTRDCLRERHVNLAREPLLVK